MSTGSVTTDNVIIEETRAFEAEWQKELDAAYFDMLRQDALKLAQDMSFCPRCSTRHSLELITEDEYFCRKCGTVIA